MTYNELTISVWQRGDQEGAQLSNVRTGQLTDEHHTSVRFVGGLDGLTPPHWLTTPPLVTAKFGLGRVGFDLLPHQKGPKSKFVIKFL